MLVANNAFCVAVSLRVLNTSIPRVGWMNPHFIGKALGLRSFALGAITVAIFVGRTSPTVTSDKFIASARRCACATYGALKKANNALIVMLTN